MTLTVTGMPVSRVVCLMCTNSMLTTITITGFSRTRPTISLTSHLFPAGWAQLTCLFKKVERCLGCTARDVGIQNNLSE